jgi:hypothetical protein
LLNIVGQPRSERQLARRLDCRQPVPVTAYAMGLGGRAPDDAAAIAGILLQQIL